MGAELPEFELQEFARRLQASSPERLSRKQVDGLHQHYCELRRWNRRISLVAAAARHQILERHYGESLAALPFLSRHPGVLLDVGTGGGFPGLVLAVARPELDVVLVEANERKWSFLMSVCRRLALSCRCVNARVGPASVDELPWRIDWITSRAVRFDDLAIPLLLPRLSEAGSLLLWSGVDDPDLPSSLRVVREEALAGSTNRRVLEIRRSEESPTSR